jgi:hypothetical protein
MVVLVYRTPGSICNTYAGVSHAISARHALEKIRQSVEFCSLANGQPFSGGLLLIHETSLRRRFIAKAGLGTGSDSNHDWSVRVGRVDELSRASLDMHTVQLPHLGR